MSESKIPSAEDLLTDLHVQADYRSTVQVIHDYARAVLEAAAQVVENYHQQTKTMGLANEIRRLKEGL